MGRKPVSVDKQTEDMLAERPALNPRGVPYKRDIAEPMRDVTLQDAAKFVAESTPIIGDAMAAKEIWDELQKEEPNYYLVGALGGATIIGLIPGVGDAAAAAISRGAKAAAKKGGEVVADVAGTARAIKDRDMEFLKGRGRPESTQGIGADVTRAAADEPFKNTVKAYKLFTKGEDGKLYPLFVDADTEVPVGQYMKAVFPEYRFKAENGNFYVPSRGTAGKKGTGDAIKIPDQETRDMLIEAGFLPKGSKAKTIKAVAARPGWHAGDTPMAKHIGPEVVIDGKTYKIRGEDQVWAEVEMPADTDWQAIADSRAVMKKDGKPNVKTAHITDELPEGGYYRYKTNPNMEGQWLISGDMKVNRILDRDEVKRINAEAGFKDLPTEAELREQLGKGFAAGGLVGEDMYQGVDDYQLAEMGANMNKGGSVDQQTVAMFKSSRGYAEGGEVVPELMEEGVDPVSGNEVPLGSIPEEVRDDIPAQLSEGEYVVPADVVRYFGVKFFEDLRNQAKMGWEEMNQNGRIGGEPVMQEQDGMEMVEPEDDLPFDISELQTIEAAEGAYVRGFSGGGYTLQDLDIGAGFAMPKNTMESNTKQIMYKNPKDPSSPAIPLIFINGKPSPQAEFYIDMGYVPASEVSATKKTSDVVEEVKQDDVDSDPTGLSGMTGKEEEKVDWAKASSEKFESSISGLESKFLNKAIPAAASAFLGPLAGVATTIGLQSSNRNKAYDMLDGIEKQLSSKDTTDDMRSELSKQKERLQKIVSTGDDGKKDTGLIGKSGIFGGKSSMYEGLTDTSGDGRVTFADTWLGDLLGLDEDGFGVQGPKLAESRAGARRGGGADTSPAAVTSSKPSNNGGGSNKNVGDITPSNEAQKAQTTKVQEKAQTTATPVKKESIEQKIARGGGFSKGGLMKKK